MHVWAHSSGSVAMLAIVSPAITFQVCAVVSLLLMGGVRERERVGKPTESVTSRWVAWEGVRVVQFFMGGLLSSCGNQSDPPARNQSTGSTGSGTMVSCVVQR